MTSTPGNTGVILLVITTKLSTMLLSGYTGYTVTGAELSQGPKFLQGERCPDFGRLQGRERAQKLAPKFLGWKERNNQEKRADRGEQTEILRRPKVETETYLSY